jgi:FKBP-type peptidyl-prolyl cis-trans isomerase (trigger factor)
MKSTIGELVDYRTAPWERNVTVQCPDEHMQTQLRHLTRPYKKTEPVTTIQTGDVLLIALESRLPKFQRSMVPVTVGGGLFDASLEEALLGHAVGETFAVTVQEEPVTVTVKSGSRTVFPEPTDEMAKSYAQSHEGWEKVQSVDDYRRQVRETYIAEAKQQAVYATMDSICEYVLTHSDWNFDEEEIQEKMQEGRAEIEQGLKEEGKSLETLTADELQMYMGISSAEEIDTLLRTSMEQNIAQDLWLCAVHGKASVEEIEGYPWQFLDDYVRNNIQMKEE